MAALSGACAIFSTIVGLKELLPEARRTPIIPAMLYVRTGLVVVALKRCQRLSSIRLLILRSATPHRVGYFTAYVSAQRVSTGQREQCGGLNALRMNWYDRQAPQRASRRHRQLFGRKYPRPSIDWRSPLLRLDTDFMLACFQYFPWVSGWDTAEGIEPFVFLK